MYRCYQVQFVMNRFLKTFYVINKLFVLLFIEIIIRLFFVYEIQLFKSEFFNISYFLSVSR